MRTIGIGKHLGWRRAALVSAVAALVVLVPYATAVEEDSGSARPARADATPEVTTITTGSGALYTTTVERVPGGDLPPEDFRQASLLAARIVGHLNEVVTSLDDDDRDAARKHVAKGLSLVGVVGDLLPTTEVTTVVRDAGGETVYRHVDRVQDDRIPLHEGMIAMKVIEPVVDAKQEEKAVQGVRLADAQLLRTSILVELGYLERRLKRIGRLIEEEDTEAALTQALLAQARGISFVMNEEDTPLVDAQSALQLAERMVEQRRHEAARANLSLASAQLDLYASLVPDDEIGKIAELQDDISRLMDEIEKDGSADEIRGFWDRVTRWFSREPGEPRSTRTDEEPAES